MRAKKRAFALNAYNNSTMSLAQITPENSYGSAFRQMLQQSKIGTNLKTILCLNCSIQLRMLLKK